MEYYDDYYDEQELVDELYSNSEALAELHLFKEKILELAKGEVKHKLSSLKAEANSLALQIESQRDTISALREEKALLKKRILHLEEKGKAERLKDLMEDRKIIMYSPTTVTLYSDKCDKCDDRYNIHYKTPLGKDATEKCDCHKHIGILYKPQENVAYELSLRERDSKLYMWYRENSKDDDDKYYSGGECVETISDDKSFETLDNKNYRRNYFTDMERCQEYCDYLNNLYSDKE